MLTLLLQHDGHRAVAVTSAAEALDHLRASYVDVVLSEIRIDSSMDGLQLSACVRRDWPRIQFVLGTSWMGLDAALGSDHGAVMILTKPYRLADLRQIVVASADRRHRAKRPAPKRLANPGAETVAST
jgi:DNA-binding NtrC family response regulator